MECAISTSTTRPTTRSTRSTASSFGRMSPPGPRCSQFCRVEFKRSRNGPGGVEPRKRRKAMRILIALPLLALCACQVSKDDANNTVSVTFNQEVAANATEDVGNFAENVGGAVVNDVKKTGDKVQNTDVALNVDTNVKTENKH